MKGKKKIKKMNVVQINNPTPIPKLIVHNKENALLNALKSSAQNKPDVHIISRSGRWAIKVAGAHRASKILPTKNEALKYAKVLSSHYRRGKVILHKIDGSIDSKNLNVIVNAMGVK